MILLCNCRTICLSYWILLNKNFCLIKAILNQRWANLVIFLNQPKFSLVRLNLTWLERVGVGRCECGCDFGTGCLLFDTSWGWVYRTKDTQSQTHPPTSLPTTHAPSSSPSIWITSHHCNDEKISEPFLNVSGWNTTTSDTSWFCSC